jgi:hypothetical protein
MRVSLDSTAVPATSEPDLAPEVSRRRLLTRSLRTATAAAAGAIGAAAFAGSSVANAANGDPVLAGAVNTGTDVTTVRNTQVAIDTVALKGVVTQSDPGVSTAGVWGQSNAVNGNGVFGIALGGKSKGVFGRSQDGRGVHGEATGTTGLNYGVFGESKSVEGRGVQGKGGNAGVYGEASVNVGHGVHGKAQSAGVYGEGTSTNTGSGVFGKGGFYGVRGESESRGVHGQGGSVGVFGDGVTHGVYGNGGNTGVRGTGATYGVLGTSVGGHAGYFIGNVHVSNVLTKASGSFLIDHPQDPANRLLEHSFVEAPEMLNVYRGTVTLDSRGRATVRLPRYFRALNGDYGYQLTAIGAPAPSLHVARKIERLSFAIAGGAPGQEVCWIVTGARHDAWAKAHPLKVDRMKRRVDRGRYLNPEVFGKPTSAAMHRVRNLKGRGHGSN